MLRFDVVGREAVGREVGEVERHDRLKPWQNGTNESFNGKFRNECLSMEWFRTRREAAATLETWRQHYNAVRPHSSIGYLTPNEFRAKQVKEPKSGEAVL